MNQMAGPKTHQFGASLLENSGQKLQDEDSGEKTRKQNQRQEVALQTPFSQTVTDLKTKMIEIAKS